MTVSRSTTRATRRSVIVFASSAIPPIAASVHPDGWLATIVTTRYTLSNCPAEERPDRRACTGRAVTKVMLHLLVLVTPAVHHSWRLARGRGTAPPRGHPGTRRGPRGAALGCDGDPARRHRS